MIAVNENVVVPPEWTLITVSPRELLKAVAWIGMSVPAGLTLMVPPGNATPAPFGVASMVTFTVLPSSVLKCNGTGKIRAPSGATRKPSPALLPPTRITIAMETPLR